MDLDTLSRTSGEWLRGEGPESDIVMSSRVRLARNLARYPFLTRADERTRGDIAKELGGQLAALRLDLAEDSPDDGRALTYIDVEDLTPLDRQFLVERQLISREHAESHGSRGVGIGEGENVSVMINEEDHLRMQVFRSGLALEDCWNAATRLDDQIERRVTYAFSDSLGYLTACPTNAGTGIRVSVMLHLPALVLTKEIQKVYQALQKISLAVRGLYGEGSQALGDFYQISNQLTLGSSEEEIVRKIHEIVDRVISWEREARRKLRQEHRASFSDQVSRAYGTLRSAQRISSEETLSLLSSVRMGIHSGFVDDLEIPTVNELFIHTQPAHLQRRLGETLDEEERKAARATYIRKRLTSPENN